MHKIIPALLLGLCPAILLAQATRNEGPAKPLPEEILKRVSPDYRDPAKNLLTATEPRQAALAKMTDDNLNVAIVADLCKKSEAAPFLLDRLEKEPSARLRSGILTGLKSYWASHPEAQAIVEKHITTDPDAEVSVKALETLRQVRMAAMSRLLTTRLSTAMNSGDADAKKQLGEAEERWYSLVNGISLPGFLRTPPPVFSVKPAGQPIRVLAFGDYGTGTAAQTSTAKAMVAYHQSHPFDFGITLGDNFYSTGMADTTNKRWKTQWEQLYGPMNIPFYATLGNHDWGSSDSPAAEILYSEKSTSWHLPAPYYTFTAGPVQFFAFDTVEVNEAELEWLDSELAKSTARWKIVYGHFHIYSGTRLDNKVLIERLLPILKKRRVDVYLNGHDHNLQEEKPEDGVHFFISGGAGAGLYDFNPYDRTIFKEKLNGFTVLEADANRLQVKFVGTDGKELYTRTLPDGANQN
jgi:tartrate-resistant acid phosphatase type 5